MNQAQLIDAIAAHSNNTGISKVAIKFVLATQAQIIAATLAAGEEVTLPGLGNFSVNYREARKGRNPSTGEAIDIPPKHVPHFSATKALKDILNR